jgi:nucleotide-binding universal stress UspA family protein
MRGILAERPVTINRMTADTQTAPAQILIAYDGSDAAGGAIAAAGSLFPAAHAVVTYVSPEPDVLGHVALGRIAVPDEVLVAAAREYRRAAAERALGVAEQGRALAEQAGLEATGVVREQPSPWRALDRAARELDADLIVCGSRGQGAVSRTLLGSTSSSLLHHAGRAVLVVPPEAVRLDGPAVIGYDASDGSRTAIGAAARLLSRRPALVVHAWGSPLRRSYASAGLAAVPLPEVHELTDALEAVFAEDARELAEEGATLARDAGLAAQAVAVEETDGVWRALSATARGEGAAVIVAGSRGRGALSSAVLGSVSAGLVHNAELPVLIVRDGREGPSADSLTKDP